MILAEARGVLTPFPLAATQNACSSSFPANAEHYRSSTVSPAAPVSVRARTLGDLLLALSTPTTFVSKHDGQFKKGWAGGPGRPRGSPNRVMADLSQLIMDVATETGFIKINEQGVREATGVDGCLGYLRWAAVNEPKTYLALMARILPYFVSAAEAKP